MSAQDAAGGRGDSPGGAGPGSTDTVLSRLVGRARGQLPGAAAEPLISVRFADRGGGAVTGRATPPDLPGGGLPSGEAVTAAGLPAGPASPYGPPGAAGPAGFTGSRGWAASGAAVGPAAVGPDAVGPDAVGPDAVGPDAVGPAGPGPGPGPGSDVRAGRGAGRRGLAGPLGRHDQGDDRDDGPWTGPGGPDGRADVPAVSPVISAAVAWPSRAFPEVPGGGSPRTAQAAGPAPITITVGHIDVRLEREAATPPRGPQPPARPQPKFTPRVTLAEFLAGRDHGGSR
jgi:hypothetical protein